MSDPTQPMQPTPAQPGRHAGQPAGGQPGGAQPPEGPAPGAPPSGAPAAGAPPSGPPAAGPQPGGAPPGEPASSGGQPPGSPPHTAYQPHPGPVPPRRQGVWRQATATRGGLIAVVVAAVLAVLLLLGTLGLGAALAVRAIAGGGDERVVQFDGDGRDGMGPFGPGEPRREDGQRGGPGDGGPLAPGLRGFGDVQHGEFAVTGPDGQAVAMLVQRGEITKASATSITVKSADDFTATYAVNEDTRMSPSSAADFPVGEQVLVLARKQGAVAVAIHSGVRG